MQCRICRHCVGCHYGPFSSSSCSEIPALRTQMEIRRRVGAHAMQAMQALRQLPLRSLLQQLLLRGACPANSNGDHVPSRCSCSAGYAGTASAVTTLPSTAAHDQRCLPCEPKWKSCAEWCSGNAGYAGTASAVTPVRSTAAHAQRCLPCELKWKSCAE